MNNYLDWDALFIRLGHLHKLSDIFTVEGLETCLQRNNLCVVRLFTLFHFFPAFKSEIGLEVTLLVTFCEDADYVSIPSFSSSIYLILTSDCLAGTSLSALHSLEVLLLFSASSFICLLTAIAL